MPDQLTGPNFDLTGQVTSADGSKAWASYRKGPGLLEFDVASNKIKTLLKGPSGVYAISVLTQDGDSGELLTGGADGYVRLWNLADITLIKEYQVARPGYFVTDAHLVSGSRRAVVGVMRIRKEMAPSAATEPVEIILLDLETGQQKKMFDVNWWRARVSVIDNQILYPEADRIKLTTIEGGQNTREFRVSAPILQSTVSSNGGWLAVVDAKKNLTVLDLTTVRKKTIKIKPDEWGPLVVTNDCRHVYQMANEGQLTKWDVNTSKVSQSVLTRIREMHTRVDFMTLANNDEWLVAAGNHGDVGIFDRATGRLLCYTQTSAAAFYVEKVWIKGNRMILTTDTGVMFDGNLK